MFLAITELHLADINTISIPTDAILIISLLIVFALLGYFLLNILDNQTNQFVEKVDDNSTCELVKEKIEAQLTPKSATLSQKKSDKLSIKKLNFLQPSKFLGISSLAILAIGGSSLLGIQNIQNSYKRLHNSQVNIKTESESAKSLLSIAQIKSSNKTKIKKIRYVNHLLSTKNSSKNNNFFQTKEKQTLDFFSF